MNNLIGNLTGMGAITDQVIATDMLFAATTGVAGYSAALTMATSPQVRTTLKNQLNDAIVTQEQVTNYMISKGFLDPINMEAQVKKVIQAADAALQLAQQMPAQLQQMQQEQMQPQI